MQGVAKGECICSSVLVAVVAVVTVLRKTGSNGCSSTIVVAKPDILMSARNPELYPFLCGTCGRRFADQRKEENHRRGGRCLSYVCTRCKAVFNSHISLSSHQNICLAEVVQEQEQGGEQEQGQDQGGEQEQQKQQEQEHRDIVERCDILQEILIENGTIVNDSYADFNM